jgi:hypothetical protein
LTSVLAREVRDAADRASGALIRLGWPTLAAAVAGRIAQFDCNWETYTAWRDGSREMPPLLRPDGKPYHRDSYGRAVRQLRNAGIVKHERIFTGVKPTGAKYATARGTTLKTFNWRAVFEKNPMSRRERRLARQRQAVALRDAGALVPAAPHCAQRTRDHGAPQHSVPPTPAPPPDLAAVIGETSAALERRWSREAADERPGPVLVRSSAAERPPPD